MEQGLNLEGLDLSNLDLRNINFKCANLRHCNLSSSDLSHCVFERADLFQANLNVRFSPPSLLAVCLPPFSSNRMQWCSVCICRG